MKHSSIFAGVAAALLLTIGSANAAEDMNGMEKCAVVKDGKGMIKAGKAACKTPNHSCAGLNSENESEAWIMVPKGQCDKINSGDMSEVSSDVKAKLNM